MENEYERKDAWRITGVFSTREDAENAFHVLMELGYSLEEVTLIMSDETNEKLYQEKAGVMLDSQTGFSKGNVCLTISDALRNYGKFISLPEVSLVVAADFSESGVPALSGSVMSDKYAKFYQTRIKEGEIVIEFQPHTVRERRIISGFWENYGATTLIRKLGHAA